MNVIWCTYVVCQRKNWQNHENLKVSWSYGSWIDNYLCKQCLSLITLSAPTPLNRGVFDIILYDTVCQWFAKGRWYSQDTAVSSTNITDLLDTTEILLKVALSTITLTENLPYFTKVSKLWYWTRHCKCGRPTIINTWITCTASVADPLS